MCASDAVTVSEQSRLRIKTLLGFFQRETHILGGGTNSYLSVWTAKPHLYPRSIKWTTRTAIFTSRDDQKNTVLANLNQCEIRHLVLAYRCVSSALLTGLLQEQTFKLDENSVTIYFETRKYQAEDEQQSEPVDKNLNVRGSTLLES